jgi:hypothetical protein
MKGSFLLIALSGVLLAQTDAVPAKTTIAVRTNERIDAKNPSDNRIYSGAVDSDVVDKNGRVMIPRGTRAELILRDSTENTVVLDLESIEMNGQRYPVASTPEAVATPLVAKTGIGANKRTGKFVGCGALIGAVIGGIAGGPPGAAVGAAAGAGAGAVAQGTTTQGHRIILPPETQITFRLDEPLKVAAADGQRDRRNERD